MKRKYFTLAVLLLLATLSASSQQPSLSVVEIKDHWMMHRFGNNVWYDATVPGCVHTDLLNHKLIPDPFYRDNEKKVQWVDKYSWEYATDIQVDKRMAERKYLELCFKGLDTYADVYLNDNLILNADNMFREWKVDVKKFIREGTNSLRIHFHSPVVMGLLNRDKWDIEAPMGFNLDFGPGFISAAGGISDLPQIGPYIRKAGYMFGWDWSPTLPTSGIWRPVYLTAWDEARISNIQLVQNSISPKNAAVRAIVEIESASEKQGSVQISYEIKGIVKVVEPVITGLKAGKNLVAVDIQIANPQIWWPNGLGAHPVYKFTASLKENNLELDRDSVRTGLRTVRLVTDSDKYGRSFYFEINGIPVFAKGADYIPTDIFPSRTTPEHYRTLLASAAEANINMLRVWGGGIYESDLFYDLCDEYGIMIWQDFAFAIAITPGDDWFLKTVKPELADNIIRLRNHPSIVFWCGNNETEMLWDLLVKRFFGFKLAEQNVALLDNLLKMVPVTPVKKETTEKVLKAYDDIYYKLIPDALKEFDLNGRPYWPSSPVGGFKEPANANSGDMHYYIAYANARFEAYYASRSRFYSEHGFQAFPDFNTVRKFTVPGDWNYLSPIMQHHQRAMGGNQVLDKYMKMYYHYPKDFETYLYVSQVMQADVMKIAFETHRRSRPYTMGTLYWQLNDVWPVASWSSMDYLNHWKALHFQVRNSFKDVIVVPQFYRDTFKLYVVSDSLRPFRATAAVRITDFNGKELKKITLPVNVEANSSGTIMVKTSREFLAGIDSTNTVCTVQLIANKKLMAENSCLFAAPKNLNLPEVNITRKITQSGKNFVIELYSDKFARRVFLSSDFDGFFSDNYFDLMPGEKVKIMFKPQGDIKELDKYLKVLSLSDTY